MKKLLLHSCCGPCSSGVIDQLVNDYDVTILYFNPNIYPSEEYYRRLEAQRIIIDKMNEEYGYDVKLIEDVYEPSVYDEAVRGLEDEPEGGARCAVCFELRLRHTYEYAKSHGYDVFTTTLSISPHKDFELINKIGMGIAGDDTTVKYLCANFKKHDGYLHSIQNSKKYGVYRQEYCGCSHSKKG